MTTRTHAQKKNHKKNNLQHHTTTSEHKTSNDIKVPLRQMHDLAIGNILFLPVDFFARNEQVDI